MITPENFAEFVTLIVDKKITSKVAKDVLKEMFETGADPSHIVEEKGLIQIKDEVVITDTVSQVIDENPKAVADYKKGKENSLEFLVGQVMAKEKGKIDPKIARRELGKKIKS